MTLVNKYAGTCAACKGLVPAEAGTRAKVDGVGAWQTYHHECAPAWEPRPQGRPEGEGGAVVAPVPPQRGAHDGWHRRRLAGFDTETTGRDPKSVRIVSAALVASDGTSKTFLIDPGVEIPAEATAIHGITTEYAREHGAPPRETLDAIADALAAELRAGTPLVVFNAPYDLTLLEAELARHQLAPLAARAPVAPVIDPLVIDRQMDKFRKGARTLEAQCRFYGVTITRAHDAAADALAALNLAQVIGASYAAVGTLDAVRLHEAQARWKAEQEADRAAYRERRGETPYVEPEWPTRPLATSA
ncbi:MAG: 3'-5' exonuclease [Catenulisporales bacterium]|nr:3'-5' exonuclease [Catenulisporales bacterium]